MEKNLVKTAHTPWMPALLVVLAPLVLFSPVYLAGQALFWGTPLLQFGPWWHGAWRTLADGHLPLWNTLLGMGAPLLANYQSALLYPPTWVYLLLDQLGGPRLMAWGMAPLSALHLAWAGLGMALVARRLGLGPLAQAVAGLAFGLSAYLVSRTWFFSINVTAAWLPWVIACLTPDLRVAGGSLWTRRRFLALSVCLALQLLAGHAQTTWYTVLLAGLWAGFWGAAGLDDAKGGTAGKAQSHSLAQRLRGVGTAWAWLAGAGLLAAGIAAAQLLPTAEYLSQSQRAAAVEYEFAMNYSFWPWRLLTLLAPGMFGSPASGDYWGFGAFWEDAIYIGLLPLLLALGTLLGSLRRLDPGAPVRQKLLRRWLPWFLAALIAMALLLALGKNTPVFPWLYHHVPTFAMFQAPTRWMIWAEFALALLAGLGAERLRRPQGWGLYWARLATMGAAAVMLGAGLAWASMGEVSPSFIRATALLGLFGVGTGVLWLAAPTASDLGIAPPVGSAVTLEQAAAAPAANGKPSRRLLQFKPPPPPKPRPADKPYPLAAWGWAVGLFVALDLLVAGWGLNPGGPLKLYDRAPGSKWVLMDAGEGRLFFPPYQQDWLQYVYFLRFASFRPQLDWLGMRWALLPNSNMLEYPVPSANNFDPLKPGRYADWLEMLAQATPAVHAQLLDRMAVGVLETLDRSQPHGVRFTRRPEQQVVRWVPCAVAADGAAQARALVLGGTVDFRQTVILEGQGGAACETLAPGALTPDSLTPGPSPGGRGGVSGDVRADRSNPNRIEIQVQSEDPGWVVIAQVWYPGWRASLDGQPVALQRADYLFQAVPVPAGAHSLVLEYRPLSFYLGLLASLLALGAAASRLIVSYNPTGQE